MQRFALAASVGALCFLNAAMGVAGLTQECPEEAAISTHICPDDPNQNSLCNMSPKFLETYSAVPEVLNTHLFENCVTADEENEDDERVTGVNGCVAPRPGARISYVLVESKSVVNAEFGIGQYFKLVFNFVVPDSQTAVPIKTRLNGKKHDWTVTAQHLRTTLTCIGEATTAGSFELWFPLKDESILTEQLDIRVETDGSGPFKSWSGVFNLRRGIIETGPFPDALIELAGPMFAANPLQIIVSDAALPPGVVPTLAPNPDDGGGAIELDSETVTALSVSLGCAAVLSLGAVVFVRRRRAAGWASGDTAGDKFNKASSNSSRARHRRNESDISVARPSTSSSGYYGSQLMNEDISTPLRVIAQVRKTPTPWRSPLASFRRSRRQTAGVMNVTQIQELTEFLRMRDPKLTTEKQLNAKVNKLSMYQRADLIRALGKLYGEVPKSMQHDQRTLRL